MPATNCTDELWECTKSLKIESQRPGFIDLSRSFDFAVFTLNNSLHCVIQFVKESTNPFKLNSENSSDPDCIPHIAQLDEWMD